MACLHMVVLLYKGLVKVYTNQTKVLDKSMTVVKYKNKDQASGLELAELFILLGCQEYKTHIKALQFLFMVMTGSKVQVGTSQKK